MTAQQTDPNLQDNKAREFAKREAAKMSENVQVITFLIQLWRLCIRIHSYSGWIILRSNFGERFLPTGVIVFSSTLCLLAALIGGSFIGIVIAIGLFLTACIHRIQIRRRNKRGEIWHSYDNGASCLARRFLGREDAIEQWGEPGIVIAAGIVLMVMPAQPFAASQFFWSGAFGLYVVSIGFAMLLQANKLKRDARHLVLDARDSQIDNQAFAKMQDRDMEEMAVDTLLTQSTVARPA